MNDNNPRSMPQIVAAAYRKDVCLGALFSSSRVFTDADRISVRDQLLEQLIAKHGSVEVKYGRNWIPIRRRIEQIQARSTRLVRGVWPTIDLLTNVEEYGLREGVLRQLAAIMQPYWLRWWNGFRWTTTESVMSWCDIADMVLGYKQFQWIAAQHARAFLSKSDKDIAQACLDTILIVEADAGGNDIYTKQEEADIIERIEYLREMTFARSSRDVYLSVAAARQATLPYQPWARKPMFASSTALADEERKRLEDITRQLITPTLITSAS